ncbi:MAG: NAD-dependent epimerase/dehydratase family protein [Pseudomonadota bacterium]
MLSPSKPATSKDGELATIRPQRVVLLTGSRGFTGSYLRQTLQAAGYRVVGLVRDDPVGGDEIAGSLLDAARLREVVAKVQPTHVVHLAAISFANHQDASALYQVNLFGTLNLLDALIAERAPVQKVVLSSSATVYGGTKGSPMTETATPAPVNHYAISKLAMEHMARTRVDELPIVLTRPFNYTGVGQNENFLVPKIVGHFQRGEARIRLGNTDVVREFNDVRRVAQAYLGILERCPAGETVNICSGRGHRVADVVELLRALSGNPIAVDIDHGLVRAIDAKCLIGDPAKLYATVGALPDYALEETLSWMLADLSHGHGLKCAAGAA